MEKFELALESAEIAGRGAAVKERKISPSLRCLSFSSPSLSERSGREALYYTLITEQDPALKDEVIKEMEGGITTYLRKLRGGRKRRVLAVGLGNPAAVADALGSETVKRLSAGEKGGGYLATMIPSVFGMTGLESASVVRGVCAEYRPDLILSVDTLATRRAERLCRAVQITDDGVIPGGGVGNRREPLSEESLGVPVISVGVPLLARADRCAALPADLMVTPKEIDLLVPRFASALAAGIERGLFE